ncbi:hypothetical protein T484DRAFT_1793666 [Baffinella frigidus]|nr:hypothetical protein T484DRAFT_1793666 [Cryptophyta sp. CCMP2293]
MAKELNELAQKMGWKVEWTSEDRTGPAHQPVFAVSLHLRGFESASQKQP